MKRVRIEDADYMEHVTCVVMPCCAFTFDEMHTDEDGEHYTCPACEGIDLRAELDRYRRALERLDRKVETGWRQATIDLALRPPPTTGDE